MEEFDLLCKRAKRLIEKNDIKSLDKAHKLLKEAYILYPTEKLKARLIKLKKHMDLILDDTDSDKENMSGDEMVHLGKGFYLYKPLYDRLFDYQRQGVSFLFQLYQENKGGILGDDMGLGKTIQVVAFLSGMFDSQRIKNALIVMPLALLVNWQNEFKAWAPGLNVISIHESNTRNKASKNIQKNGGIGLLTYGLVKSIAEMNKDDSFPFEWDYMFLDEGHQIKNPAAKTTQYVNQIPSKHRIIMSGTPLMNNLNELWSLFNWTHHGNLLGQARTFAMQYGNPITKSKQKDASITERTIGDALMKSLKDIISPYIIRRTKADLKRFTETDTNLAKLLNMPTKNDFICWIKLTEEQIKIYSDFISQDDVKALLMTKKSPLVALTILKRICDHPRVLSNKQCNKLGLECANEEDCEALDKMMDDSTSYSVDHLSDDILFNESGKMNFLMELLEVLKKDEHKCLIFSRSKRVLTIIEKLLLGRRFKSLRLDGDISKTEDRQKIIDQFQSDKTINLLLLTIQVGGVGLTLTAASRVIIFDPNWNPATDSQAVDRAFRIGQKQNVIVYRLITCGTVEEKIYRRQIFKDSINKSIMGDAKNPIRHFSAQDLRELFKLDNPEVSATQLQLAEDHKDKVEIPIDLQNHITYLESLDRMFGVSHHNYMFDEENELEENPDDQKFAHLKVTTAQQLITNENDQPGINRALTNIENAIRGGKNKVVNSNTNNNNNIKYNYIDNLNPYYDLNEYNIYQNNLDENKFVFDNEKPIRDNDQIEDKFKIISLNDEEIENTRKRYQLVEDNDNSLNELNNDSSVEIIKEEVLDDKDYQQFSKRVSIFRQTNDSINSNENNNFSNSQNSINIENDLSFVNPYKKRNAKKNIEDDEDDNNREFSDDSSNDMIFEKFDTNKNGGITQSTSKEGIFNLNDVDLHSSILNQSDTGKNVVDCSLDNPHYKYTEKKNSIDGESENNEEISDNSANSVIQDSDFEMVDRININNLNRSINNNNMSSAESNQSLEEKRNELCKDIDVTHQSDQKDEYLNQASSLKSYNNSEETSTNDGSQNDNEVLLSDISRQTNSDDVDEDNDDNYEDEDDNDEQVAEYSYYVKLGFIQYQKKEYKQALETFLKAQQIHDGDDRIRSLIQHIQTKI